MQAFPVNNINQPEQGMTLRDYFAAKAMAAMIVEHDTYLNVMAELSYEAADAMMRAREGKS